ncbi:Conjugative transfer protein TrbJ [Candidatus Paraburkholderia calva]|nr:Conjugative transfer protein TrbJ [Candidatus Paraburkholderia calva]
MIPRRTHAARLAAALLTTPIVLAPMLATPAQAIIVFDPSNYAQNVLQAARALQQINQQIMLLQNQAQMLMNPGVQPRAPALLLAPAAPVVNRPYPAAVLPGVEDCLRRPADRSGVPAEIRQRQPVHVRPADGR